ncbi:hypothetical protein V1477_003016 [Vespula maculifrons]|uniref:Uncharacterized protein n=1 Tax=Vespula maculifrons TaxID=7453 RepID=A0ABD2CTC2_VESMC
MERMVKLGDGRRASAAFEESSGVVIAEIERLISMSRGARVSVLVKSESPLPRALPGNGKGKSRICRFGVNVAESSAAILRTKRKTSYLADVSSRLLIGKKSGRLLPPLAAVFLAPFLASPPPRYHREKAAGSGWRLEKRAH